jgi:branched-chain amino acid transport system permease protein
MEQFVRTLLDGQQWINGLSQGAVYALFALGFTLVFGVLGLINLAHGATYMWGAFIGWVLVARGGLPVLVALPLAMLAAGLLAVLLERIAFKPLRALTRGSRVLWVGFVVLLVALVMGGPRVARLIVGGSGVALMVLGIVLDVRGYGPVHEREVPHLSPMISSLGASSVLVFLAQAQFGADQQRYPFGPLQTTRFQISEIASISLIQVMILLSALMLVVGLHLLIQRSRVGRAIRAIAWSERTARLLGVNVDTVVAQTFFVSGALAGAAGVLIGLLTGAIRPDMGIRIEMLGLTAIIVGGMGSIVGAIAGGLMIGLLQTFSIAFISSDFRDAIVFALLLLVLFVRPSGIFGRSPSVRA